MIAEVESWAGFIDVTVTKKKLSLQFCEKSDGYTVFAVDHIVIWKIDLKKDTSAFKDFEANYKAAANQEINIVKTSGINEAKGMRGRLVGSHSFTALKTTSTNKDWTTPQLNYLGVNKNSYFDGIEYYAKNAVMGDHITFQVVDVDGSGVTAGLYDQATFDALKDGNGEYVVEEFGDKWLVMPDTRVPIRLYKARLYPALIVRAKYTSLGTVNDVDVIINLYRHLDGKL